MATPSLEFTAVDDVATTKAARELIGEYLRWIAQVARENYGLSFAVDRRGRILLYRRNSNLGSR